MLRGKLDSYIGLVWGERRSHSGGGVAYLEWSGEIHSGMGVRVSDGMDPGLWGPKGPSQCLSMGTDVSISFSGSANVRSFQHQLFLDQEAR